MMKIIMQENGSTLIGILVLMTVLAILGSALFYLVSSNYSMTEKSINQEKAYYNARAGVLAISKYIADGSDLAVLTGLESDPVEMGSDERDGQYVLEILSVGEKTTVKSTGVIEDSDGNIISRSIIAKIKPPTNVPELPEGVVGKEKGEFGGSFSLVSNEVGINSSDPDSLKINWSAELDTYIVIPEGAEADSVINHAQPDLAGNGVKGIINRDIPEIELPPFPDFPDDLPPKNDIDIKSTSSGSELEIYGSGSYDKIKVSNNELTINVLNDNDIKIRVNDLSLQGNTPAIKIEKTNDAEGDVIFYVENNINFGSDAQINPDNSVDSYDDLYLYYKGESKLSLINMVNFNGSIYTEKADINIAGSSNITANILSGGDNLTIAGASDARGKAIIAPEAEVKVTGSGDYKGSIYCNSFKMTGDGSFRYDDSMEMTFDALKKYYDKIPDGETSAGGSVSIEWIEVEDYKNH